MYGEYGVAGEETSELTEDQFMYDLVGSSIYLLLCNKPPQNISLLSNL